MIIKCHLCSMNDFSVCVFKNKEFHPPTDALPVGFKR